MQKRTILWYMTFWGSAINYMIRMNLNIAIVDMVQKITKTFNDNLENEIYENSISSNTSILINTTIDKNTFEWNEHQQNIALGAIFWLNMILQIPGGLLTQKYSAASIFGISNGAVAFFSCVIPLSTKYSFNALVFIRVLQGLIAGISWPSMHAIVSKWIPPHERSRFGSAYLGFSVGTAVTYMLGGYLTSWIGWESVFYSTGIFGLLWYGFWTYLIYDSPETHPTITFKERKYIQDSLSDSVVLDKNSKIPWKSIFTSVPFNVNVLSQIGYCWGHYTLSLQIPTYLKIVLGFNMKQTGIWSGIPHLLIWPFSFIFGCACDYLIKNNIMSTTKVRKLACFSSNVLHGLFILLLSFSGNNDVLVVFNMVFALVMSGAISSGALPGIMDLAPNYAGVLQGINGTIVCCFVGISPYVVGLITFQQQTIEQWKKVFIVSALFCIITGLIFIIFGSSKLQKWNNTKQKDEKEIKLIILK